MEKQSVAFNEHPPCHSSVILHSRLPTHPHSPNATTILLPLASPAQNIRLPNEARVPCLRPGQLGMFLLLCSWHIYVHMHISQHDSLSRSEPGCVWSIAEDSACGFLWRLYTHTHTHTYIHVCCETGRTGWQSGEGEAV